MEQHLDYGVVVTPDELRDHDWIEHARRLGIPTLGIHTGGALHDNAAEILGRTVSQEFRECARLSHVSIEYRLHAISSLLPRWHFRENPDWFVFDVERGGRVVEHNFCPSNPSAMDEVTGNALKLARILAPTTNRFFFWSDDGRPWCRCIKCRTLTDSDQELLVANELAHVLRRDYDKSAKVSYLAYRRTINCPQNVRPATGVFLEFAPIERDLETCIGDRCSESNSPLWRELSNLLRLFPAQDAHVLDYWLDSSLISSWRRPAKKSAFNADVFERDLAAYLGLGIHNLFSFAVFMDGAYFQKFGDAEVREFARGMNCKKA